MSEAPGSEGRAAFSQKSAEIGMALFFLALAALVMYDSVRLGATWGADGPKPGYFPFYVGLILAAAAVINLIRGLMIRPDKNRAFVHVGQLKLVLTVLVPASLYAGLIGWIGIYVASALFIAFFMRWLGEYPWWKVAGVSVGVVVVFYLIFEVWFLVPLPKGPLESWLGLG